MRNAHRRSILRASLWGTAGCLAWVAPLFGAGDPPPDRLRDLAIKVTSELNPAFCGELAARLARDLKSFSSDADMDVDTALQLLHADDLAFSRIQDIHGVKFSHTQLGTLISLLGTTVT
jgi:hypothetical protein